MAPSTEQIIIEPERILTQDDLFVVALDYLVLGMTRTPLTLISIAPPLVLRRLPSARRSCTVFTPTADVGYCHRYPATDYAQPGSKPSEKGRVTYGRQVSEVRT